MTIGGQSLKINIENINTIKEFCTQVNKTINSSLHKGKIYCAYKRTADSEKPFVSFKRMDRRRRNRDIPDFYDMHLDKVFLRICGMRYEGSLSFQLGLEDWNFENSLYLNEWDFDGPNPNNVPKSTVCMLTLNVIDKCYVGMERENFLLLLHVPTLRGTMYEPKTALFHRVSRQHQSLTFEMKSMDNRHINISSEKPMLITLSFLPISNV
jgi:hypothetical protein